MSGISHFTVVSGISNSVRGQYFWKLCYVGPFWFSTKPEGSLNISVRDYALPCESKFRILKKVLLKWTHLRVWNDHMLFFFSNFNFSCYWVRFPASAAVGATSRRLRKAYFTGSGRAAWCNVVGELVCYQSTTLFSKRIWTTTYHASVVVLYALLVVRLSVCISASSHRSKGSSLWNTIWEPLNNSIDS